MCVSWSTMLILFTAHRRNYMLRLINPAITSPSTGPNLLINRGRIKYVAEIYKKSRILLTTIRKDKVCVKNKNAPPSLPN